MLYENRLTKLIAICQQIYIKVHPVDKYLCSNKLFQWKWEVLATTRAISPANTVECRIEDFSKTIGAPIYYLTNFPQKRLENEKKIFPVGVGVRGVRGVHAFPFN